jgi:hypothetical protein
MSFQPQVPMIGQLPPVGAAPPPPAKRKRRKGLMLLGIGLLVGGVVGGGFAVLQSKSNYESEVKSLARAPVGCTTTLVFDKPAEFVVYIETKGKISDLSGDCQGNGSSYDRSNGQPPKISLTLLDADNAVVDFSRASSASYDAAGFIGTQVRTLKITNAGTYHLDVESPDKDFAIAIGKNPQADRKTLRMIGAAIVLAGVVLGLLCLLLGLRRRPPALASGRPGSPMGPLPGWTPGPYAGGPPTAPPTHPGYRPTQPPMTIPGQPPSVPLGQSPSSVFAPPTVIPSAPTVSNLPTMPSIPTEPPVSTMPTAPTMPPVPTMPTIPTEPSVPTMPTIPRVPSAPADQESTGAADREHGWAKPDDES